ncbi:MAG: HNH endonuclease, partial [Holosporales bacterium]|jgi:5-methylcytosine-specific restriction endonuclease McrA|nr:HNH endonuclease [Holosporales bacterium]
MKDTKKRKKPTPNFDARLLAEINNNLCPLCGKRLLGEKAGESVKLYDVAHIYPHSPTREQLMSLENVPKAEDSESFENLIALCKDCHKKQDFHTKKEEYMRLYNKKQQLMCQTKALDEASVIQIEDEIEKVLQGLKDVDIERLVPLSYGVVSVDKKIAQENGLLLSNIRDKVVRYFPFVQETFRNIDRIGSLKFDIISTEIKLCFQKVNGSGLSQEEIFYNLVEWLKSKTQCQSTQACEIIISFFVQNCEVFDAFA